MTDINDYQVLILAGGLGTRLKPITETVPKPLVDINGKPFLEILIEYLKRYGLKNIVICSGYLGHKIEDHFGNGSSFGVNMDYSHEKEKLGTAGAIKNAEPFIKSNNFIVMNGDSYLPLNYESMIKFHKRHLQLLTMAVTLASNPKEQELIQLEGEEIINYFIRNTPEHTAHLEGNQNPLISGGVYIMKREFLNEIPPGRFVSFENEIFPKVVHKSRGFFHSGYMKDIGVLRALEEFKSDVKEIH